MVRFPADHGKASPLGCLGEEEFGGVTGAVMDDLGYALSVRRPARRNATFSQGVEG